MLQTFKNGQGSIVLRVKLLDSTSTTGAGITGLTSASSGLKIAAIADNEATTVAYTVAGSTVETITTLGTYAAPTATKCRFKEVDATNHPGVYELHLADARFAVSNARSLLVSIGGATNLAQADFVVQLQSDDPYVAKPTNYASLSIDSNGRVDVIKIAGTSQTARDIGASVLLSSGTGTGQLDFTSGVVKANAVQLLGTAWLTPAVAGTPDVNAKQFGGAAVTATTSVTIPAASTLATTTGAVGSVTGAVGSVTGLTASDVAAIKAKTDNLPADPADASDIASSFSSLSAAIPSAASNAAAVLAATVEGSVTVVQSMRLQNAAAGGKASGLNTTTASFRDLADTKDRIIATVDADGNRSAVLRDLT